MQPAHNRIWFATHASSPIKWWQTHAPDQDGATGACDTACTLLGVADEMGLAHLRAVTLDFITQHYSQVLLQVLLACCLLLLQLPSRLSIDPLCRALAHGLWSQAAQACVLSRACCWLQVQGCPAYANLTKGQTDLVAAEACRLVAEMQRLMREVAA